MRRAQSSIDFLLVFALFLLLFVILYQFVLHGYFAKSTEKQIQLSARIEAEKVAFAVESAALVGN